MSRSIGVSSFHMHVLPSPICWTQYEGERWGNELNGLLWKINLLPFKRQGLIL